MHHAKSFPSGYTALQSIVFQSYMLEREMTAVPAGMGQIAARAHHWVIFPVASAQS